MSAMLVLYASSHGAPAFPPPPRSPPPPPCRNLGLARELLHDRPPREGRDLFFGECETSPARRELTDAGTGNFLRQDTGQETRDEASIPLA